MQTFQIQLNHPSVLRTLGRSHVLARVRSIKNSSEISIVSMGNPASSPQLVESQGLGVCGSEVFKPLKFLQTRTTAESSTAVEDAIRAVTKSLKPCRCFRQPTCSPLNHCIFTCAKDHLSSCVIRELSSDIGLKKIVLQRRSRKHCLFFGVTIRLQPLRNAKHGQWKQTS